MGIGENTEGIGFAISVDLHVSLPGHGKEATEQLIEAAHKVCPYSNATRGNIIVNTRIV